MLTVALWLRSFNYAYWAGGMTAALALLYGYYGEGGIGLLGDRLEGILGGGALAVAASWLLWPVRTTDVLRRDTALALAALDAYLASLAEDLAVVTTRQHEFQQAAKTLAQTGAPLRAAPVAVRASVPYLPTVTAAERCAAELPAITAVISQHGPGSHPHEDVQHIRAGLRDMRRANGQPVPPDAEACEQLVDRLRGLSGHPETLAASSEAGSPHDGPRTVPRTVSPL